MLKFKFWILLVFNFTMINAQTIKGRIVDANNNLPIVYAHLLVAGDYGVVSNEEGFFSLYIKKEHQDLDVQISALGYETILMNIDDFKDNIVISLKPTEYILDEVIVGNSMQPQQIIKNYIENSPKNHRILNHKLVCFKRSKKSVFFDDIVFDVNKVSFFNKIDFQKQLNDFTNTYANKITSNYEEALYEIYHGDKSSQVNVVKGLKLKNEQGLDMNDFEDLFFDNILKNLKSPYTYNIKTGWIPIKRKASLSKIEQPNVSDTLKSTNFYDFQLNTIISYLEFIQKPQLYDYVLEGIKIIQGFPCYHISFRPGKSKGKYNGDLYIHTEDFAMIRYKYALEDDKNEFGINLKWVLGIKIKSYGSSNEVFYTRSDAGFYYPMMSKKSSADYAYIDRSLSFKENHPERSKRKILKFNFQIEMTQELQEEILVVETASLTPESFKQLKTRNFVILDVQKKYDANYWEDYNILEATQEMKRLNLIDE